jgi:hypothetical protein
MTCCCFTINNTCSIDLMLIGYHSVTLAARCKRPIILVGAVGKYFAEAVTMPDFLGGGYHFATSQRHIILKTDQNHARLATIALAKRGIFSGHIV